jgi:hypothetical protein
VLALLLTCSGLCGLGCRQTFEVIYKKLEKELHERKKEMVNVLEISNIAYEARDQVRAISGVKVALLEHIISPLRAPPLTGAVNIENGGGLTREADRPLPQTTPDVIPVEYHTVCAS